MIYISSLYIETMKFKELFVMYCIMAVQIKLQSSRDTPKH